MMHEKAYCRVGVVILNWNGAADTIACLDSLSPCVEDGLIRIVVVDNASTDGSVARLREWIQRQNEVWSFIDEKESVIEREQAARDWKYVLYSAGNNGGYAAGNNHGIRICLGIPEIEFIFILNNDTEVEQACIPSLLASSMQKPEIAAWGVTIEEGGHRLPIAGGANYNRWLTISKTSHVGDSKSGGKVEYLCGAAMFIRARVFREIGLFDEKYFLFFEELDLALRMKREGLEIAWCSQAKIFHAGGRSTGSRSGCQTGKSKLAEYHSNRSCLLFSRNYYPRTWVIVAITRAVLKIIHCVLRNELELLLPLYHAYRDFVFD